MQITTRDADAAEIDRLAQIWFDGWHESHAPIVPGLRQLLEPGNFRDRLHVVLPHIRVVGEFPSPVGRRSGAHHKGRGR